MYSIVFEYLRKLLAIIYTKEIQSAARSPKNLPSNDPSFKNKPEPVIIRVPVPARTKPRNTAGFILLFKNNFS